MSQVKTIKEVLTAARWMIDNIGWCQNKSSTQDQNGKYTGFCSVGAIWQVEADFTVKQYTFRFMEQHIPGGLIAFWNDQPGRTKTQVLNQFDRMIEAAV